MGSHLGAKERRARHALLIGAFSAVSLGTFSAHAQTSPFENRLRLRAPAECPSASELSRQIVEQLSQQGLRDAEHFAFEVEVARLGDRYRGRLRVLAPEPSDEAREVEATDCADLMRALALVIAVLVGPESSAPPAERTNPELAPDLNESPALRPNPLPPPLPALLVAPTPAPTVPPAPSPAGWRVQVGGAAEVVTGMAPQATLEPRFGVSLDREPTSGPITTLATSFRFAHSSTVSVAAGDAVLDWRIGRAAACRGYRASAILAAGPCVGLELGRLSATGRRALDSISKSEPWLAAVGSLRGTLRPLPIFQAFVELSATFPFDRPNFYFRGPAGVQTVYDVPLVGFAASLGMELTVF